MTGKNITPLPRVFTEQQIAEAQAKAEQRTADIRAEGMKAGHAAAVHGDRYRLIAAALVGVIIGALGMGMWGAEMNRNAMFSAGAVIDRALARTVPEPSATLPPALEASDPGEAYQRNAAEARADACRRGVRDPRTGRCPGEPGN